MKIALAQMYIRSGQFNTNFETIKKMVLDAKNQNADLIVFPAMCISGTCLSDKFLDPVLCEEIYSYNEKILELSDSIGIVFGNLYYDKINNSLIRSKATYFAYNKKWVKNKSGLFDGICFDCINKNEGINDDYRYFTDGNFIYSTFNKSLEEFSDFTFNTYHLSLNKLINNLDYTIVCDSKPYCKDECSIHYSNHKEIHVNHVGMFNTGKNIVVYDGASYVSENNELVVSLNDSFKEELKIYEEKVKDIALKNENKVLDALTYALKEVDLQMFNARTKWIIGLSGGIDSCINAALLVKAIGNKRIVGYNMASAYNSLTTKNNARILAEGLGIEIREGSIELLNEATLNTMDMYKYKDTYGSLVYENIQARIRGHLLSTFASIEGGVVINNANKIEVALGYCTLYGDAIGALSPIGDLTKVECFEVARQLNKYFDKEIISYTLIPEIENDTIKWDMPPSAELKDAQFDPMKWFYHDEIIKLIMERKDSIESFMTSYLDDSIYNTSFGKWITYYHLDKPEDFINDLEWLYRTLSFAVFKRIQTPPVLKLSSCAFGSDYRESQLGFITSDKYKELKDKILNKKNL